jgi:hypothetical protein
LSETVIVILNADRDDYGKDCAATIIEMTIIESWNRVACLSESDRSTLLFLKSINPLDFL